MCNPVIAAGLAIVSGIADYQTQSAIAKHSNKVADAQIEASYKARDDQARQLNTKQDREQMDIADKREADQLLALKQIEKQKVLNAETGAEGRSIDLSVIQKENDLLKYNTSVNRVIDDLTTAYAFKREGLYSQLQNRIMQADASRKPKPSLGAAIVKTAFNATMAYGGANGGFGEGTASLGENFANIGTDINNSISSMSNFTMPDLSMGFDLPSFSFGGNP